MQNASAEFISQIMGDTISPVAKATIQTAFGQIYELTNDQIVVGSLCVTSKCFESAFALGGVFMSELQISWYNLDGFWTNIDLTGATIWPYSGLVLSDGSKEYSLLGTFIIDQPGRPYDKVAPIAHDRMLLLDTSFSGVDIAFPTTNYLLIEAVCAYCNIPLDFSVGDALNITNEIATRPTEELSCRDVVSMIATMAAGFARMTRAGTLEIASLPRLRTSAYVGDTLDMGVGSRFDFKQLTDQVTITGLQYGQDAVITNIGTTNYMIVVDEMSLLQANVDEVIQSIFDTVGGFTYFGYTATYIGNPLIDVGDVVVHTTRDGKVLTSLISGHDFKHGNRSTMSADAKSKFEISYKTANSRRLSAIATKVVDVQANLSSYQQAQAQFTELITQAMGYFTTDVIQEDGSIIHYEHDKPILAESTLIYKKSANTPISWSSDGGVTWGGIDADGNIIAQTLQVLGLTANWIVTGIMLSKNGRIKLDLDSETFTLGSHILDISTGTLKFISSQHDDALDYIFQRAGSEFVNMKIVGDLEVTESLLIGSCKAESRDDVGNEGIDFVF